MFLSDAQGDSIFSIFLECTLELCFEDLNQYMKPSKGLQGAVVVPYSHTIHYGD